MELKMAASSTVTPQAVPQATPGGNEEARLRLLRLSQRRLSGPRSRRSAESDFVQSPSRKVPMDTLAKEWIHSKAFEPETRVYLSQRLLPPLILSLEKLLETVGNRGMEEDEETGPDFNPINYLAEQLMRSNPAAFASPSTSFTAVNQLTSTRSATDTRSSTYAESMREVSSQLQQLVCHHEDEQGDKDRIREELKKRKEEREKEQAMRQMERERRKGVVKSVVGQWCEQTEGGGRDGGVTVSDLLQAVQKWLDEVKQHPQASTITECMSPLLSQNVDGDDLVWTQEHTCTELLQYCYNLSADGFTLLTEYFRVYIEQRRQDRVKASRRKILREVFYLWDKDELNMVARQELLDLLTAYYNTAPPEVREKLSNPENWPLMSDADKMSWLDDEEEEEEEGGTESQRWSSEVSDDDLQQFLAEPVEQKEKQETEPKDKEENDKEAVDETEKKASEEPTEEKKEDKDQDKKEEELDKKEEDSEKEEVDKTAVVEEKHESTERDGTSDTVVQPLAGGSEVAPAVRDGSGSLPLLPSGPGGQWSPTHLSLDQFVHVCEMFVGEQNDQSAVQSLATFLTANITNTEHKTMALSDKMKQQALLHLKAHKISALFTLWDGDCAGSLNVTELELVVSKWSGFSSKAQSAVAAAMASFRTSRQLTRAQFTNLLEELSSSMEVSEFREFADFLQSSFKSTHEEKVRTQSRQQWLSNIRNCGQTSGLLPALQEVVQVIEKDAKQFGSGKSVSVCVSVLESATQQQQACLMYKAASDNTQDIVLGKKLHKSSAPVSFSVVESGITVHIPNVAQHGKVFFFNSKLRSSNNYRGSLVVAPILTAGGRVLGTISVDSLTKNEKAVTGFAPHELSFIQGVGVCLGEVLCYIAARKKLISAAETGMMFLQQRCRPVLSCDFYIVKPLADEEGYQLVLAKTLDSGQSLGEGGGEEGHKIKILTNKHDIYREYLFQCVDSSEPVATELHCLHHLATPLRDSSGCAIAVLDITLAQSLGKLSRQHRRDIAKTVRLLSMAFQQMSKLEEGELDDQQSAVALFHSLLLADLNSSLSRVDNRMFAELRSYVEPPIVVMKIVQSLLMILHPYHQWTEWGDCKQSVTLSLLKTMQRFDPTLSQHHSKIEPIKVILRAISPADVFKHGSLPTKYLYTWVSSCSAVLEHCSPS